MFVGRLPAGRRDARPKPQMQVPVPRTQISTCSWGLRRDGQPAAAFAFHSRPPSALGARMPTLALWPIPEVAPGAANFRVGSGATFRAEQWTSALPARAVVNLGFGECQKATVRAQVDDAIAERLQAQSELSLAAAMLRLG